MPRDTLGHFEHLVLLACLRNGEEAYTVPLIDTLELATGRRPSHAAVYVALRRLEERGLVESHLGAASSERGGRPKRLFRVRQEAMALLDDSRRALESLWKQVEESR